MNIEDFFKYIWSFFIITHERVDKLILTLTIR